MKWEGRRQSTNVDDRRGMGTTGKVAVGGGALGLIFLLFQLFLGGDPAQIQQQLESQLQQGGQQSQPTELSKEDVLMGQFVKTVFADTEDVWNKLFQAAGKKYREPKLVLFNDQVRSACGGATSSSGPFYCPGDETVYMDLTFFELLRQKFGAKGGDFAIAYVIAHEVGHHVQHQQGILSKVQQMRSRVSQVEGNKIQVPVELQADFFAGVWAHHIQKYLEEGDIEEALNAAAVVGNDYMQKRMQGHTNPETYTHGTSEQRMYWFSRGFKTGDLAYGDTFKELLQ
ncbi:MAG: zinc metallopeptidase [Saprospiraceae bacterium]|nr:zinc metallopeptidase [Saprospiraceae bacterium]